MKVERFIFGPFQTNCYVVSDDQQVWLIDPACSCRYEQEELYRYISNLPSRSSHLELSLIATHGHLDHLWGAKWASEQWNTPVRMHEADIPMARAMQEQYDLFGIRLKAEPFPIERIQSTDRFADREQTGFRMIETPGHTLGSICLYWPEDKILFSGDTLFCMGYGRTDLPGGNFAQLIDSLDKLMTLPDDIRVFPGHGEFTSIAAERR